MSEHRARGFIIARAPVRENDLHATLLTEHGARLSLLAPGGQRSSRRFTSGLMTLCLYDATWTESRRGLRLDDAAVLRAWPALLTDLRRNAAATVATGVAAEVAEPAPGDGTLFLLLGELYESLSVSAPEHASARLLRFTAEALAHAGTALALDRCVRCDTPAPEGALVTVDPREGGVVCRGCGGGPYRLRAVDRAQLLAVVAGGELPVAPRLLAVYGRLIAGVSERAAEHIARALPLFGASGE